MWIPSSRVDELGRVQNFQAFLPRLLGGRGEIELGEATVMALSQAAITLTQAEQSSLMKLPRFRRALLHVEAIGSSWFEGIQIGHRKLEEAIALREAEMPIGATSKAVIGNIEAMQQAIEMGGQGRHWSPELFMEIHRTLMKSTYQEVIGGWLRDDYIWIGGTTPQRAAYVAPPADRVGQYLDDLCEYMNRTDIEGITQAAVAHAQFESIHPFADGNGRTGRCLIQALLHNSGLVGVVPIPFSQVVTGNPKLYIEGLTAFREGRDGQWIESFARILRAAAEETITAGEAANDLLDAWKSKLQGFRRHSTSQQLPEILMGWPVLNAATVERELNVSREAARLGLLDLARLGILKEVNVGKNQRQYIAPEALALTNKLEQRLRTRAVPGIRELDQEEIS